MQLCAHIPLKCFHLHTSDITAGFPKSLCLLLVSHLWVPIATAECWSLLTHNLVIITPNASGMLYHLWCDLGFQSSSVVVNSVICLGWRSWCCTGNSSLIIMLRCRSCCVFFSLWRCPWAVLRPYEAVWSRWITQQHAVPLPRWLRRSRILQYWGKYLSNLHCR